MDFEKLALGALGVAIVGYGVKKWLDSEMEKAGYDGEIFGYQDVIIDKLSEAAEGFCDKLDDMIDNLDKLGDELIDSIDYSVEVKKATKS